jgi:hypothetical protein
VLGRAPGRDSVSSRAAGSLPLVKQIVARYAVVGAGALLMLIGALVLAFRPGPPEPSFGWSAYAPLSQAVLVPSAAGTLLGPIAIILVIIGFCGVVAWIGFQIGRTRTP